MNAQTSHPIGYPLTRIRYQRTEMVNPTEAVAHRDHLRTIGMSDYMIARAAGTAQRTIYVLHLRESVTKTVSDAVLGVSPRPMHQQAYVLAFGAHRRLDALACAGHSQAAIGAAMGVSKRRVQAIRRNSVITWEAHAAVRDAFTRLWDVDGGSTRSKIHARRSGLLPALAYDDLDDFYERPKRSVLRRGRLVRGVAA
ncbi:hypothetical protein [Nocardia brasiliensis]|uniref:hypothetical protein n=1 Tax=Nocardia brasiliensis TaxID=37326 RepID=UPI0024543411|nr:hypothetical protein [Nocardia brasiliensis]